MNATTATPETPTVVARATFKDPQAINQMLPAVALNLIDRFVKYSEYITVELMSDGTARVVPVSEMD